MFWLGVGFEDLKVRKGTNAFKEEKGPKINEIERAYFLSGLFLYCPFHCIIVLFQFVLSHWVWSQEQFEIMRLQPAHLCHQICPMMDDS